MEGGVPRGRSDRSNRFKSTDGLMMPCGSSGRLTDGQWDGDRWLLPRVSEELEVPRGRLDGMTDAEAERQSVRRWRD